MGRTSLFGAHHESPDIHLAALIFVTLGAQGQAFMAAWLLLNPQQQAGIGAATVSPESIGP